jgi:putative ABC transport system permease protein
MWIVPPEWRDTVARDLDDEAERLGKTAWWIGAQAAAAGLRLRRIVNGDVMRTDLRYAVRSLVRSRWFALGAVLTFALGIGVNVAVFSAVDRMLFRKMPFDRPDDLYVFGEFAEGAQRPYGTVGAQYLVAARQLPAVENVSTTSWNSRGFWLTPDPDDGVAIRLALVSYSHLATLGVHPAIGRDFTEEDVIAKRNVTLISDQIWRARFSTRPDIIGQALFSGDTRAEIIGVLPKDFINGSTSFDPKTDGLTLDSDLFRSSAPRERRTPGIIRLKAGASPSVAAAQFDAMSSRLLKEEVRPANVRRTEFRLVPLRKLMFGDYGPYMLLIVGAASLVFLVACANLSSLMLVRGRDREHQFAIQRALGASSARMMQTAMMESACLAIAGASVAALFMVVAGRGLDQWMPPIFSRFATGLADWRVIAALALLASVGTVVAGLVPARRAARADVVHAMSVGTSRGASRRAGGRWILVVESAVCLVLVSGAAVSARSLVGLLHVDLGLRVDGLFTINAYQSAIPGDVAATLERYRALGDVIRQTPGISSVGGINESPLDNSIPELITEELRGRGLRYRAEAEFFGTVGARVLAGRAYTADEVRSRARVGVVTESAVKLLWSDASVTDAVGRSVRSGNDAPIAVVGVVADMRASPLADIRPSLFIPPDGPGFRFMEFHVRTTDGRKPSLVDIRQRLKNAGLSPAQLSITDVRAVLSRGLTASRFQTVLFGSFGIVALALAAIGLYAVASFEVSRRQREIGVRLALGADRADVTRMVIVDAVKPVVIGAVIGLGLAYWAGQFLQAFVIRVDARDPGTLGAVVAVLLTATGLAAWFPARRAARTDPATVLRAD